MLLTKYTNIPDHELITQVYMQNAENELALELALRLERLLEEVEDLLYGDLDAKQRLQEILDGANSRR